MTSDKTTNTRSPSIVRHLLSTKLSMPQLPSNRIKRDRLKLYDDVGGLTALTVICAPAGFGKTTALLSGLAELDLPTAWLALDSADNDAVRFLGYVIAALRTVIPDLGDLAVRLLGSPNPPKPMSLMVGLLNEISCQLQPIMLALDDYHLLESTEAHELMAFLIEQQPACLHIVLTTRRQPKLPLPRLRVRGQVTEFNELDLRFNHEEAQRFFRDSAGLQLSEDDVAMLEARTEGWAAGLQLAALSLQGDDNPHAFIQAFAGDDRFITDYLTEEVLRLQSDEERHFLLQTSILERLNGALCDAVTGRSDSEKILRQLEQSDMFLVPLDNRRHWYRYHHLFAELLQGQLLQSDEEIVELHRRAAQWFTQENSVPEAMAHAFEIDDYPLAIAILDQHGEMMFSQGQCSMLAAWFERIPFAYLAQKPSQLILNSWVKYVGYGELDQALIVAIEQALLSGNASEEELAKVEFNVEFMKGFMALQQRDYVAAERYGESIVTKFEDSGEADISAPKLHLGVVYCSVGKLEKAHELLKDSYQDCLDNGSLLCLNGAVSGESWVLLKQGRLSDVVNLAMKHIALLQDKGWLAMMIDVSWIYLCLGDIAYQRNQQPEAKAFYDQAMEVAQRDNWEAMPAMIDVRQARVCLAMNQVQDAQKLQQKFKHYNIKPALLPLLPSPIFEWAELDLRQGKLQAAEQWLSEMFISVDQPLRAGFDAEYRLLVQLLLQQSKTAEAVALLNDLQAQSSDQPGQLLQWWVLQALVRQAQGNTRQALEYLQQSLLLAEKETYVRVFIDEGKPMALLLAKLQKQQSSDYIQGLLAQFGDVTEIAAKKMMIEQLLSKKEQNTLQLLLLGLSNNEIAERAFVSVNTVKTHLKNIYAKLSVDNRLQAIEKARELM